MPVRTTVDIPEPLHDTLRARASKSGTSIRALIVQALEQAYEKPKADQMVTRPMVTGNGKRGPRFPVDENPYDLIFP